MNQGDRNAMTRYRARSPYARSISPSQRFGAFDQLRREMDDMFNRMLSTWDEDDRNPQHQDEDIGAGLNQWDHSPAIDFEDGDDAYHLSIELPGTKAEDIDVNVSDGVLRISGEKRSKSEDSAHGRKVQERTYGRFSRSLRLPSTTDQEKISASFEDGVLELTIPKSGDEETRSHRIAIETSSKSEKAGKKSGKKSKSKKKS